MPRSLADGVRFLVDRKRRRRLTGWTVFAVAIGGALLIGYMNRDPYSFLDSFHPRRDVIQWPWSGPDGPRKGDPERVMLTFPAERSAAILAALRRELVDSKDFTAEAEKEIPGYWTFDPPGQVKVSDSEVVFDESDDARMEADRFRNRGVDPDTPSPPLCYVILPPRPATWFDRVLSWASGLFHREEAIN